VKTATFDYPLNEFEIHWREIHELDKKRIPSISKAQLCHDYFSKSGAIHWERKERIFYATMAYLDSNAPEFDEGKLGVIGKKEVILSSLLIKAVHFYFSRANDEQFNNPPTPQFFKDFLASKS
jgi:hypothetical protein